MTPRLRHRRRLAVLAAAVVLAVGAVGAGIALHRTRVALDGQQSQSFAAGDCVVVPASAPKPLSARRAPCAIDPSYTIGAITDASGTCPSAEYQHFPSPVADQSTASLCLVPNLIADHCYQLDLPIGVVERAGCADPRSKPSAGVLVQVTQRLDVHNEKACPGAGGGQFAWPYPSPARTYCTQTIY
jgi:hypothetical protein